MNNSFKPMTDQQREEVRLKRLTDQEYAVNHLYIHSQDEQYHRELGAKYGVRMPSWWIPASEIKYVRRACKKLGVEVSDFADSTGFKNIKEFVQNNPKWTAFSVVALVLEWYHENTAQKAC